MELSLLCGSNMFLIIEDIETNKKEVYSSYDDTKTLIASFYFDSYSLFTNKDVNLLFL